MNYDCDNRNVVVSHGCAPYSFAKRFCLSTGWLATWSNEQAYSLLLIGTHMNDGYQLNVGLLCGAGFLRAVSSSLIWVYSTLVIQSMVLGPEVRDVN